MKYAIPLLVLLMGADLVLTFIGLDLGAIESNPLWSRDWMAVVKIIATLLVIAGFYVMRNWRPTKYFARVTVSLMGLVVVNNLIVLYLVI